MEDLEEINTSQGDEINEGTDDIEEDLELMMILNSQPSQDEKTNLQTELELYSKFDLTRHIKCKK